jgi:hypothetical protein
MTSFEQHKNYRTFGADQAFAERDHELSRYWHSHTPPEPMEVLGN